MLRYNAGGSVFRWEYNAEVARVQLCHLIPKFDLPLCFVDCDVFNDCIKSTHNPRHCNVSRQTTTRDMEKYFKERHVIVAEKLKYVTFVALTSDIWSGNAKEDYLSVVAHFVTLVGS
jgi:hypothetical protein